MLYSFELSAAIVVGSILCLLMVGAIGCALDEDYWDEHGAAQFYLLAAVFGIPGIALILWAFGA